MKSSNQTHAGFSRVLAGSQSSQNANLIRKSSSTVLKSAPLVSMVSEKRSSSNESSEDEDEDSERDSDDESEDGSDSDDSIVVPDNEVEVIGNVPEEDDDLESSRKVLELIKKEADDFIGEPLKSTLVGNRVLRDRKTLKSPDRSHLKLVNEAFERDEKKELIGILNGWKKKYSEQVKNGEIVMPSCNLNSSSLDEIRNAYKRFGSNINNYLEPDNKITFSDDDSESESSVEDMNDEDSTVSEMEDSESESSESSNSDYDMDE